MHDGARTDVLDRPLVGSDAGRPRSGLLQDTGGLLDVKSQQQPNVAQNDGAARRAYAQTIVPHFESSSVSPPSLERFMWALSLFGLATSPGGGMFFLEAVEILRRTVWAIFRIEWEVVVKVGYAGQPMPLTTASDPGSMSEGSDLEHSAEAGP